jgi:N-acetylmuramic acid 6-phosphate etherase
VSDHPQLDALPSAAVIELLLDAEARVVPAVRGAAPELAKASDVLHAAIVAGGRLIFAGAGTSGRLAAAEAAELPGTFGIDAARCIPHIAGAESPAIDDAAEDDAEGGAAGIRVLDPQPADVVIAVAASGRTPFTLAAAREARDAGVPVIAVVNAPGTPLAALATAPVEIVVGDEVLRGSTRLTAGTAQKIALNTLTTAAMARAGRVHGALMIDMVAANAKLRDRAAGIVAEIAGCSALDARAALTGCDNNARAAVLHLVTGLAPADAIARAAAHDSLRAALDG